MKFIQKQERQKIQESYRNLGRDTVTLAALVYVKFKRKEKKKGNINYYKCEKFGHIARQYRSFLENNTERDANSPQKSAGKDL